MLAALAALACLGTPPAAHAIYEPVASGATVLRLDPSFRSLLAGHGVRLEGRGGVRVGGATVTFPVSGGKFDPTTANGFVTHEGSLVFARGARSIPLKALQLKTTQRRAPFSAKLGGGQLKIASAPGLRVTRAGFGETVTVEGLALSAKTAGRLEKKLRLRDVFESGQPLGSAKSTALPALVALQPSGRLTFVPDPALVAKLNSLSVPLNPIAPAELAAGPVFTMPIASGQIAPDASTGVVHTAGSLEALQLGGGQVFWRELSIDLAAGTASAEVEVQPSPPYAGKQGAVAIATIDMSAAGVAATPKARTIALSGARLALSAQSAIAFNEAFAQGKAVFAAGEALGSFSFTGVGQ